MAIRVMYINVKTEGDNHFHAKLDEWLQSPMCRNAISIQHIEYHYSSSKAVIDGKPCGARYMITLPRS